LLLPALVLSLLPLVVPLLALPLLLVVLYY
jgi:hypothetical protein